MPYKTIVPHEIETKGGKIRIEVGATIYTTEEKEQFKKMKEIESIREQVHIDTHNHGGFTFLKTVNNSMETLKPETVGRIVYLSTYLDFDSPRLMAEPKKQMRKRDLQYFLNIGETKVRHFCDECIMHGIMEIDENNYVYLDDVFFRGKSRDSNRIKLFCKTIQDLYKQMPPKHHKYFGYVIQLVPWINYEWNVICKNPEEKNYDDIVPWTMKEICEFAHYDTEHFKRFQEAILKCRFEWKGYPVSMCGLMLTGGGDRLLDGLVVNPHLVFHGTNFKKVEGIAIFFTPHDQELLDKFKDFKLPRIGGKRDGT